MTSEAYKRYAKSEKGRTALGRARKKYAQTKKGKESARESMRRYRLTVKKRQHRAILDLMDRGVI